MWKQVTVALFLGLAAAMAQEDADPAFEYLPPVVAKPFFDDSLSMFEAERAEYASNLANVAAREVDAQEASAESLQSARRILALALHLDRRNRTAMVVNGQLKRGVVPQLREGDYNARTFSRLLLSRARLLKARDNERERFLARCFTELAALIDPRNEDAVFEYENQLLDDGEIDWKLLTEATRDQPSQATEE